MTRETFRAKAKGDVTMEPTLCNGFDINGRKICEGDTLQIYWPQKPCIGTEEVYNNPQKHKVVKSLGNLTIFHKGNAYLVYALTLEGNKPKVLTNNSLIAHTHPEMIGGNYD